MDKKLINKVVEFLKKFNFDYSHKEDGDSLKVSTGRELPVKGKLVIDKKKNTKPTIDFKLGEEEKNNDN